MIALLASLPLGNALARRRPVRWLADGRLEIAGGWFMLLFAVNFVITAIYFQVVPQKGT